MTNATKVGIFSIITVIIFVLGFYYLKGINLFVAKNKYYAVYDKVDGLYKSNQVVVHGYKIGMVSDMKYNPVNGKITVEFTVDDEIPIPDDSKAIIVSTDFLGGKVLNIELGSSKNMLKNMDTIQSSYQSDIIGGISEKFNPVLAKVGSVLNELEVTLKEINSLFKGNQPASIRDAVANLNKSLAHLEAITSDIHQVTSSGSIQNSLKNVESFTANLNKSNAEITRAMKNVGMISDSLAAADIKGTIEEAQKTLSELRNILAEINKGKGTIGKLVKDDKLYADIDSTINSLDLLLKDLKANPYRYVNFSLFGGKKRDDAYLKKQSKK
ncbi:MAG: MlaD family protein [Chitinophagales bacterium]|nr:MlaD family protein [Chitinophagales bacterium]MDW8272814.1 MlaD family protein [Chitinophagales bacterium]